MSGRCGGAKFDSVDRSESAVRSLWLAPVSERRSSLLRLFETLSWRTATGNFEAAERRRWFQQQFRRPESLWILGANPELRKWSLKISSIQASVRPLIWKNAIVSSIVHPYVIFFVYDLVLLSDDLSLISSIVDLTREIEDMDDFSGYPVKQVNPDDFLNLGE